MRILESFIREFIRDPRLSVTPEPEFNDPIVVWERLKSMVPDGVFIDLYRDNKDYVFQVLSDDHTLLFEGLRIIERFLKGNGFPHQRADFSLPPFKEGHRKYQQDIEVPRKAFEN